MRRVRHVRGRYLLLAVIAGAASFGIAAAVQAAIPDANNVIHACYTKAGTIRVVENGATDCRPSELPLTWNQQGPAGPAGPQGETGPAGPAGTAEAVGADGNNDIVTAPTTLTDQADLSSLNSTFTTTQSGKLYVSKTLAGSDISMYCSSGPYYNLWWFITVDGTPVPSSLVMTGSAPATFSSLTLIGVTETAVDAGTHTLGIGMMCRSGYYAGGGGYYSYSGGSAVVLG